VRVNAKSSQPGPRQPALIELLRAADTIWNSSRLFFARWELSPSQFNILNLLRLCPAGLTQVELSRQLLTHRSNITGLVDRLEERGLLNREDEPGDRRSYRVVLSSAGGKLVAAILPAYHRGIEDVLGSLSVRQAGELAATCQQITKTANELASRLAASEAKHHEN
jgi:DNA-binding MarR family transcriptional regulator